MFPSDWAERKGTVVSKRRKVQPKETLGGLLDECDKAQALSVNDCPGGANHGSDTFDLSKVSAWDGSDSIVDVIKRRVNDSRFAPAMPVELQLDHVLSSVPYQAMLESLFGGVSQPAHEVPLVTKSYEESFMREPTAGELPCALGEVCECRFIDRNAPFVGVQFELPGTRVDRGNWAKMCVLCYRKTTQKLFYDACYSGRRVQGLIQHYGNLCNQPGEYARSCMLICPPNAQWQCMPLPIMSHQRNRYRVHMVAGVKHLQQLRVAYEDFVPPSDKMLA
jgi:hypothetical protein